MTSPRLILASASPARAELLSSAGLAFEVLVAPEAVEVRALDAARARRATPEELTLAAARAKAGAVAEMAARPSAAGGEPPEAVILAADTVVAAADGGIVGKGRDAAESEAILRRLAGSRHRVVTGVVILGPGAGRREEFSASSTVEMAAMSDSEIAAYVASGAAAGAAGAYRIQRGGTDRYVRIVEGGFSNVVGLPLEAIIQRLAALGVRPAGDDPQAGESGRSR